MGHHSVLREQEQRLERMIPRCPFQPHLFCHSTIINHLLHSPYSVLHANCWESTFTMQNTDAEWTTYLKAHHPCVSRSATATGMQWFKWFKTCSSQIILPSSLSLFLSRKPADREMMYSVLGAPAGHSGIPAASSRDSDRYRSAGIHFFCLISFNSEHPVWYDLMEWPKAAVPRLAFQSSMTQTLLSVSGILQISQWRLNRSQCCCFCPVEMLPVPRSCASASAPSSVTPIRCCNSAATTHSQATPSASLHGFHIHFSSELVLPLKHLSR